MKKPGKWRYKHPCVNCEEGYGFCVQGLLMDIRCCNKCDHPSRWDTKPPYTEEDHEEMRNGNS